jgi:hypothetical protein
MRSPVGRTRVIAAVLLLAYLPACSSWRVEKVSPQALIEAKHPAQVRVSRPDGTKQVLHQPSIAGDTLRGSVQEPAIALGEVQTVETRHGDTGKSLLLVGGIFIGAMLAGAIVCAASDCLDLGFGGYSGTTVGTQTGR